MELTVKEILKATHGRLVSGDSKNKLSHFSIDSRTIKDKEAFIAIRGQNFDGHDFIYEAYRKGVRFFIVNKYKSLKNTLKDALFIKVEDTIKALAEIAHLKRLLHEIPLVAVTGSCGKTTTKDMLAGILSSKYNVLKNIGTENNQFGVPLTLLKLTLRHKIIVLEMGMNHPGEIRELNNIACADMGIITCIHSAHLGYLKNVKNIAKTKWELIETLKGERIAILNNDDKNLKPFFKKFKGKMITFGIKEKSDFTATNIDLKNNTVSFKINRRHKITLNLLGYFNIYNALASIAAARVFKIGYERIKMNLFDFKSLPMRMEKTNINDITVINDGYNANPQSFALAVKTLSNFSNGGRTIMVCCDMLELGKRSRNLHTQLGRLIVASNIDYLITMGKEARWIYKAALKNGMGQKKTKHAKNAQAAAHYLNEIAKPKDTILLKGSRLMKTEEIIKCFMSYCTP